MPSKRKLEVFKESESLLMTLHWFTPKAYFLVFFTILWNLFLLFWYSFAVTGAPLIFTLFPLIHVGVGIWLIYYTIGLFVNKTFIDIVDDHLIIEHKPLPWWGNKEIPTKEIDQLYVKEIVKNTDKGVSISYELRVKLLDNRDESVLSLSEQPKEKLQEIEEILEQFIGIKDKPVRGEFDAMNKVRLEIKEPESPFAEKIFGALYNLENGDFFSFRNNSVELVGTNIIDFGNSNPDKIFQTLSDNEKEVLFYFKPNGAILRVYQETKLDLFQTTSIHFREAAIPSNILFNKSRFLLSEHQEGNNIGNDGKRIAVKQWLYFTEDKTKLLRISSRNEILSFYIGSVLKEEDFKKEYLDLNERPEMLNKTDLEEGDFV